HPCKVCLSCFQNNILFYPTVHQLIHSVSIFTPLRYFTIFYIIQHALAKSKNISNCPMCALIKGKDSKKIWKLNEMDADHVTAWSKGGATDEKNCQVLCKYHNRSKGNN
ncbi:MAG: HNH endonuclease, partial [Selenomonadaceae bacterium]|nr:HNH endonuclease [Selenomonadaceae bacterium]